MPPPIEDEALDFGDEEPVVSLDTNAALDDVVSQATQITAATPDKRASAATATTAAAGTPRTTTGKDQSAPDGEVQQQKNGAADQVPRPATPTATTPTKSTLPPGWTTVQSRSGATYYYHKASGVSQWDLPSSNGADVAAMQSAPASTPEPSSRDGGADANGHVLRGRQQTTPVKSNKRGRQQDDDDDDGEKRDVDEDMAHAADDADAQASKRRKDDMTNNGEEPNAGGRAAKPGEEARGAQPPPPATASLRERMQLDVGHQDAASTTSSETQGLTRRLSAAQIDEASSQSRPKQPAPWEADRPQSWDEDWRPGSARPARAAAARSRSPDAGPTSEPSRSRQEPPPRRRQEELARHRDDDVAPRERDDGYRRREEDARPGKDGRQEAESAQRRGAGGSLLDRIDMDRTPRDQVGKPDGDRRERDAGYAPRDTDHRPEGGGDDARAAAATETREPERSETRGSVERGPASAAGGGGEAFKPTSWDDEWPATTTKTTGNSDGSNQADHAFGSNDARHDAPPKPRSDAPRGRDGAAADERMYPRRDDDRARRPESVHSGGRNGYDERDRDRDRDRDRPSWGRGGGGGGGYDDRARGHDERSRGYDDRSRGHDERSRGYDDRARGHDDRSRGYDGKSSYGGARGGGYRDEPPHASPTTATMRQDGWRGGSGRTDADNGGGTRRSYDARESRSGGYARARSPSPARCGGDRGGGGYGGRHGSSGGYGGSGARYARDRDPDRYAPPRRGDGGSGGRPPSAHDDARREREYGRDRDEEMESARYSRSSSAMSNGGGGATGGGRSTTTTTRMTGANTAPTPTSARRWGSGRDADDGGAGDRYGDRYGDRDRGARGGGGGASDSLSLSEREELERLRKLVSSSSGTGAAPRGGEAAVGGWGERGRDDGGQRWGDDRRGGGGGGGGGYRGEGGRRGW